MKIICKYVIPRFGLNRIDLPVGAQVLSVGVQGERFVFWAYANPQELHLPRNVALLLTGESIPEPLTHKDFVGTVSQLLHNTYFVCHVFID